MGLQTKERLDLSQHSTIFSRFRKTSLNFFARVLPCRELKVGIPVTDENGNRLGESANAAKQAITQVVVSRILMAAPGMAIPPFIMNTLEKKAFLKRFPWMSAPVQVGLVGFCLVFATPLCCALFPQKSSMSVTSLEAELQAKIQETYPELRRVYFNKGL